jgi:WD40 repeat protein
MQTKQRLCILRGYTQRIQSIAFDVSGTKFASVSTSGTMEIWQLTGNDSGLVQTIDLHTIDHRPYGLYYRVVWPRPDCMRIGIMTTTEEMEVWDGLTRQCIFTQPQARGQLGLSHAGDKIAYATPDHEVWVCNIQTKQVEAKLIGHTQYIVQIKWSQDDSKIVTVGMDTTVRVWNMCQPQPQVFRDHTMLTHDAAFSPDGTKVVSISYDDTCRIWDLEEQ